MRRPDRERATPRTFTGRADQVKQSDRVEHLLATSMLQAAIASSSAVASACARASSAVSSQEELLGVALEAALDEGNEAVIQELMLVSLREDRFALVDHGELIFTCCEKGFAQAVTILLAAGVSGHMCLPTSETTPLHVACTHGHTKIVHNLLAGRAQVDAQSRDGASPLSCATEHGQFTIVRLLLACHATVNHAEQDGTTALHKAASKGLPLMLRLLLEHDADANALATDGETPLSAACRHGQAGCVAILLAAGARDTVPMGESGSSEPRRLSALEAAAMAAAGSPQHAACVEMLRRRRSSAETTAPASPAEAADGAAVALTAAETWLEQRDELQASAALASEVQASAALASKVQASEAIEVQASAQRASRADALGAILIAEEEAELEEARRVASSVTATAGRSKSRRGGRKAKASARSACTTARTTSAPSGPSSASTEAAELSGANAELSGANAELPGQPAAPAGSQDQQQPSGGRAATSEPPGAGVAGATGAMDTCGAAQATATAHQATLASLAGGDRPEAPPGGGSADSGADSRHEAFICPITQDLMSDPVVTADGQTYERVAIERWIHKQQSSQLPNTSPLTGAPLEHTNLVPNVVLRGMIRELLEPAGAARA